MEDNNFAHLDMDALMAFAIVARERNMRKAAQLLLISQPPLTRKIRRLENRLGLVLFERHSRGMDLTEDGAKVLKMLGPFLAMAKDMAKKLEGMVNRTTQKISLGLTTAFEQLVFEPYLELAGKEFNISSNYIRKESPGLVRDVLHGKLDAAFVALPLDTSSLAVLELNYSEKLLAVLPAAWLAKDATPINLQEMNGKPLFWFQRRRNPLYFDHMSALFREENFSPILIDEPVEHDVLLARISFGEGWCLMPESFRIIKRNGIKFVELDNENVRLSLGLVCEDENLLKRMATALQQA